MSVPARSELLQKLVNGRGDKLAARARSARAQESCCNGRIDVEDVKKVCVHAVTSQKVCVPAGDRARVITELR